MNSRRIVLFDIDGTLMRGAGPHHKEALIEGAKSVMKVGCTLDGVDTTGQMDRDLLFAMLERAGVEARLISPKMMRIMEAAQHHYCVHCKADFSGKLCPGVKELLDLLAVHEIPTGLVTGNLSGIAWQKLENAKIDGYFSFGAFSEEAPSRSRLAKLAVNKAKRKNLAARRCKVTLIGDHANDVLAAKENDYRSVAVATGMLPMDELVSHNPDLILANLEGATIEQILGQDSDV